MLLPHDIWDRFAKTWLFFIGHSVWCMLNDGTRLHQCLMQWVFDRCIYQPKVLAIFQLKSKTLPRHRKVWGIYMDLHRFVFAVGALFFGICFHFPRIIVEFQLLEILAFRMDLILQLFVIIANTKLNNSVCWQGCIWNGCK